MANRRFQSFLGAVALTLFIGCGEGSGSSANPSEAGGQIDESGNAKKQTKEAKEAFSKAVEAYRKAVAGGTLDKSSCNGLADRFTKVYKKYGDQMLIARYNAGATLEVCGELDKAKEIYVELTTKTKYRAAFTNLGVIYWNEGNSNQALSLFEKAVEMDKAKAFAARNNLAVAHRDRYSEKSEAKDFEEAQSHLRNVLVVDTSNRKAYENLARLYYDKGRLEEKSYLLLSSLVVDQALRVLAEREQDSSELRNLQGLLFLAREGNQVDAYRAFKKAVELEPKHIDANLNIAFISIRFRDYATAEKSLEIALTDQAQKRNIEAYLAMGVAKRGMKKFKEARSFYEQAGALDAKDPRPHFNIAILKQEHLVAQAEDVAAIKSLYIEAQADYKKFLSVAGDRKEFEKGVTDVEERLVVLKDALETFELMKELEKQAAAMAEAEKKADDEERQRLLKLEQEAMGTAPAATAETKK